MFSVCGVNPETDYRAPNDYGPGERNAKHAPNANMSGFEYLQNFQGLWLNWTTEYFSYEDQPSCPDCGNSSYLYCIKTLDPNYPEGVCVSRTASSCTKNLTLTTVFADDSFVPLPSCLSEHRLRGFPGDGRTRDISVEDANDILVGGIATRLQLRATTSGTLLFVGIPYVGIFFYN